MGFSRQEYWSGLPYPLPGDLPYLGIKLTPPAAPALQKDSLLLSYQRIPWVYLFCIHLSIDGYLSLLFKAIMNNTFMNICVHVFVWKYVYISLGHIPRSGISVLKDNCIFYFWSTAKLFPKPLFHFVFSIAMLDDSVSASSPTLVTVFFFIS